MFARGNGFNQRHNETHLRLCRMSLNSIIKLESEDTDNLRVYNVVVSSGSANVVGSVVVAAAGGDVFLANGVVAMVSVVVGSAAAIDVVGVDVGGRGGAVLVWSYHLANKSAHQPEAVNNI